MTTRWWRQTIPWGDIVVEVGPRGVTRISLPESPVDERVDAPRRDLAIARQLDEYFAGTTQPVLRLWDTQCVVVKPH